MRCLRVGLWLGSWFALGCPDSDPDAAGTETEGDSGTSSTSSSSSTSSTPSTSSTSSTSSSPTSDPTGDSSDESGGTTAAGDISFEQDVWPMLSAAREPTGDGTDPSCIGHHAGGVGGLALPDAATAYANLIDIPATSGFCARQIRVVPGDPDASCFLAFFEVRLRDELGWVDAADAELVRAWIVAGAPP